MSNIIEFPGTYTTPCVDCRQTLTYREAAAPPMRCEVCEFASKLKVTPHHIGGYEAYLVKGPGVDARYVVLQTVSRSLGRVAGVSKGKGSKKHATAIDRAVTSFIEADKIIESLEDGEK